MVKITSVRRFMVSMSPSVVTHVISADGYVIVPAPRLILSLLISPDVGAGKFYSPLFSFCVVRYKTPSSRPYIPHTMWYISAPLLLEQG